MSELEIANHPAGTDLNTGRRSFARPHPDVRVEDILETLPEAAYTTDPRGRLTFFNGAALKLWGVTPKLGETAYCGSWKLFLPDGAPLPHAECAMARALNEQRAVRGLEAIAERPDGSRVAFRAFPTPLFDGRHNLVGGLNVLVELPCRGSADASQQQFAAIVESSNDAIIATNLDGAIVNWNAGAERLYGHTAAEAIGRNVMMLAPADRRDEAPDILERVGRGERIDHYETVRRRKDGSLVEISLSVSPVRNPQGVIIGAAKIARDITERRRAEEQQHLMLREMDHRVKNLFAVTSSVVMLSARSAATPRDLAVSVSGRLNALARAHSLTTPGPSEAGAGQRQATTIHALIDTLMSPYDGDAGAARRVIVTGADIELSGSAVTSFALLLHEFATNAAKYGALSVPAGRVEIACARNGEQFSLEWSENGGPAIEQPPQMAGFGSVLASSTVKSQLSGEITRDWRPEGLRIRMVVASAATRA